MLSVTVHIRWLGVLWAAIIRYNSSVECSAWYACSVCSHSSWSYWGHFVLINSLLNSVEHGVINIKSICLCKVAITSLWVRGFLVCVLVFFCLWRFFRHLFFWKKCSVVLNHPFIINKLLHILGCSSCNLLPCNAWGRVKSILCKNKDFSKVLSIFLFNVDVVLCQG